MTNRTSSCDTRLIIILHGYSESYSQSSASYYYKQTQLNVCIQPFLKACIENSVAQPYAAYDYALVDFKRNLNQYCPLLKEEPAHENCSNFYTILFFFFIYVPRFSLVFLLLCKPLQYSGFCFIMFFPASSSP